MPKVSVLMNCFNGAQFLKEAIDSVYAQTYLDWEIVFIDNCSIDNSLDIVNSYNSKIKVIQTKENIPLGAARNFGIKQCSGEYIAFLDVDDIWLPNAIEVLLTMIESDNYALAYARHLNIDMDNNIIGKMAPVKKKGMIFGMLLEQFDIPIVASMVSKKHLLESSLVFDDNIHASEEYCLFMQLAARYPFIASNEFVTKYRIHNNALTGKTVSKWATERRYTLNKILQDKPELEEKYLKEFQFAHARADYYQVQALVSVKKKAEARKVLRGIIFVNWRYGVLYLALLFPMKVWFFIQEMKYKR